MLPCPSHASHSARPSLPQEPVTPSAFFLLPELQSRDWLDLILCSAPGPHCSLGLHLTAITARSSQDEWGCRILEAGQLVPGFWC